MTKYVINGGKMLNGEVTISGAKNAAVAIVPAALLADGPVRLENVPKIIDVTLQMEIMRELGAQIRQINSTTVEIQNSREPSLKPHELERKLRASYYLLGVLLGNLMPAWAESGFSVMLFGMFIAIIIPVSRQNRTVLGCVGVSFACSFLASVLPFTRELSEGMRILLLTSVISALAAILFPHKEDDLVA